MFNFCRTRCAIAAKRCYATSTRFVKAAHIQYDAKHGIEGFNATEPAILTNSFRALPAIEKWFTPSPTNPDVHTLHLSYLEQHADSLVPLELTRTSPDNTTSFERFEAPLALLLAHMTSAETPSTRLYLAQHSLADLPAALQADLPTPAALAQLGRGDIYASSVWMGKPPTRTPLHRDPNPNLFVQMSGQKVVRLLAPEMGRKVYERVRAEVGRTAGRASMRGEEMMQGREMEALEEAVWGGERMVDGGGVEAFLNSGDGLYIPLGWWHAVRGVGEGANASVNWWFR